MSTEQYKPNPEEVKKAEEMLLPVQKDMTEAREALAESLKDAGLESIPSDLRILKDSNSAPFGFSFTIRGVFLEAFEEDYDRDKGKHSYIARVDGVQVPDYIAERIWNQYDSVVNSWFDLKEYEKRAAGVGRVEEEAYQEIVAEKLAKIFGKE